MSKVLNVWSGSRFYVYTVSVAILYSRLMTKYRQDAALRCGLDTILRMSSFFVALCVSCVCVVHFRLVVS